MVIDYLIQPQDNKPCSKAKKIAILAGQLFKIPLEKEFLKIKCIVI